jgi:LAO/AO transport system kinase
VSAEDAGSLLDQARAGSRRALGRILSWVERGDPRATEIDALACSQVGRASTVGITGAPGAGKSTLTNALCRRIRRDGDRVAVLAIDPSSPFSGGAILGDRVRMTDHDLDDGVYVRSMATRGHLGGLAAATPAAIRVLDAVGFPWVLIETVGVGQVEVEVAGAADTTVVVVNPGWGDAIQANKAGLMEIGDIFVINKADRPGADVTRIDLESMLALSRQGARTPIICSVATEGIGVDELWSAIRDHLHQLAVSGQLEVKRRARVTDELRALIGARLAQRLGDITSSPGFDAAVIDVLAGRCDPATAVRRLVP